MLYQRGKEKTWWYRFRFGGKIVHESARTQSKTVAREAEKQRRRVLEESWNRITKRTLPPTLDKAAGEWLKKREGEVAPNTMSIARVALKHILPTFGSKLLCDIAPADVAAYQQARLHDGAQGRTVNLEIQTMRQIMKANKCWKHLDGEIKWRKERKDVGRALTPEDEDRLLQECGKTDSACLTAVTLALNSTMRSDEIKRLHWRQVDLFERVLTVGKSKTDAGTGRLIPLNPAAIRALADWANRFPHREPEHYVFPFCEGGYFRMKRQDSGNLAPALNARIDVTRPTKGWRSAWRTATHDIECPECGKRQRPSDSCRNPECQAEIHGLSNPLAGLRFHDLRHCAITKLAEGQASEQTIKSIAGHVSRAMLEHYSHIRLAAKRAALDSIATPLPKTAGEKEPVFEGDVHQIDNQIGLLENQPAGKLLN
jgi:integrase